MRIHSESGEISAAHTAGLSLLFSRIVSGQISESSWSRMMSVLDESVTTHEDRFALANFLNDACLEIGPDAIEIPHATDVEDMLTVMRSIPEEDAA